MDKCSYVSWSTEDLMMWNKENERRSKHRFTLQRELRFKVLENDRIVKSGTSQTIDISSGGVAFEAGCLKNGALVELSISWPVLLDETCLMRLIVFGRVVRAGKRSTACTIDRYEFRTQARVCQPQPAARVDSTLRRWAGTLDREMKSVASRN
jgi:hypothetical protein